MRQSRREVQDVRNGFRLRLERTAQAALRTGNTIFGTTLTVSPHKNYSLVSAIGCELANKYHIEFLDIDFKKKAGFQRKHTDV